MEDKQTQVYFNRNIPEYSLNRFRYAVKINREQGCEASTLVDIGCGTGNILELIRSETPVREVCGIDASEGYVKATSRRLGCDTFLGSVLDKNFIRGIGRQFDFVLLGAVLHHLVDNTRRQSRGNAHRAVENALEMIKPGGRLILIEPAFYPSVSMSLLFYVKRLVTRFTSERFHFANEWNNIGAPVVSYYTNEELRRMVRSPGGTEIIGRQYKEQAVHFSWRLLGVYRKTDTTFIVRKIAE